MTLTEVPLTPISNSPVMSISAPDSASIAPHSRHTQILVTLAQVLLAVLADYFIYLTTGKKCSPRSLSFVSLLPTGRTCSPCSPAYFTSPTTGKKLPVVHSLPANGLLRAPVLPNNSSIKN